MESRTLVSRIRKHSGSEYFSRAVDLGLHLFTLDRMNKACLAGLFGVPRGHAARHAPCNVTVMKPCSGHRWNLVLAGSQPSPVLQCPRIDGGRQTWPCLLPWRKETQMASGAPISDAATACVWKHAAKFWPGQSLTQHSHLSCHRVLWHRVKSQGRHNACWQGQCLSCRHLGIRS